MEKILMILGDGIVDRPIAELEGRTPLQVAETPALDRLAAEGEAGGWRSTPPGEAPGTDAALRTFFGYRDRVPRGALEASGAGVELRDGEVAFRANFVCLQPGSTSVVMLDSTGCGVSDEEGGVLVDYLNEHLVVDPGEEVRLLSLGGHRVLLTYWKEGERLPEAAVEGFSPPHEILGQPIGDHLPATEGARRFVHIVNDSQMILSSHPGLREKAESSMFAANSLWLWGGGGRSELPPLSDRVGGRRVTVVSSSPAVAGMARLGGAELVCPRGAGAARRSAAVEAARGALASGGFVLLSEEEADEASRRGDVEGKVAAIERFDAEVVAPLLDGAGGAGPRRVLVVADHVASAETRGRTADPVPYAMADWEGGRLRPPRGPGGLAGLWRRLLEGPRDRGGDASPPPEGFSELLCKRGSPLAAKALLARLLAG